MIISHVYKFIYYAPVRTGTTTVTKILTEKFGASMYVDRNFGVDPYPRHDVGLPAEFEHYFTFASIRNPYDRAISAYNWSNRTMVKPVPVHEAMVDPPLLRPIWNTLFDNPIKEGCVSVRIDAYLRLENLENDFVKLPFVYTRYPFPKENESPKIIDYLDENSIHYVNRHYTKDFDYFGYDKLSFRLHL